MNKMIKQLNKASELINRVDDELNARFHTAKSKKNKEHQRDLCRQSFRLVNKIAEMIDSVVEANQL